MPVLPAGSAGSQDFGLPVRWVESPSLRHQAHLVAGSFVAKPRRQLKRSLLRKRINLHTPKPETLKKSLRPQTQAHSPEPLS